VSVDWSGMIWLIKFTKLMWVGRNYMTM